MGQCSADMQLDWKIFEEYFKSCVEWELARNCGIRIIFPAAVVHAGGGGEFADLSPTSVLHVKVVLLEKKQHRGVATPLLSNNYSQLMDWYGQLKSAVYPGL